MTILYIILASIASAALYRLGGTNAGSKWRDWGVPAVVLLTLIFILKVQVAWWIHVIGFGLMWAAISSYYDEWFGYDNFFMHGFMCALAYLPYVIVTHNWWGFVIRCIVCTLAIGFWSLMIDDHVQEEAGRGFVLTITLPLLLI